MHVNFGLIKGSAETECFAGRTCKRGHNIFVDAAITVCDALRLACTFAIHNDTEFGDVDETGKATGLIGAIQDGLFDASPPMFTPTYSRYKAVDFSDAYLYGDYLVITRMPSQRSGGYILGMLKAFQWQVWCALVGTLAMTALFITLLINKVNFYSQNKPTRQSDPVRIMAAIWSIGTVVLISAYTGVLFAEKVVCPDNLPFKDFASFVNCLEKSRCRMIQSSLSANYLQYLTAPETELGRRIRATWLNKPIILKPLLEIPKLILEEKEFHLAWITTKIAFNQMAKGNKKCQFYTIKAPFKALFAFTVPKRSLLLTKFNQIAPLFRENGLSNVLEARYTAINTCTQKLVLNQSNFQSANAEIFYVYCFGVFISVVALGTEIARYKCQWRQTGTTSREHQNPEEGD